MVRKLFTLLLICLTGCLSRDSKSSFHKEPVVSLDVQAIKARGYIQALVDDNSFSYFIYKGRSMGYEYEMLQNLADVLKVDLKITLITGIEEAIDRLNTGKGDILAFPLTITQERQEYLSFTQAHFSTHQVLVQKKPDNWQRLSEATVDSSLIHTSNELVGKTIHIMKESAFRQQLENLSREIGGEIIIKEDSVATATEFLIRRVSQGEIGYTVTDQMIAMINSLYYPNLDIGTIISPDQPIGWAVRKNSPELLLAINDWLTKVNKSGFRQVLFTKYFESPRFLLSKVNSDYSSLGGNKLSPYDDQLREGAKMLKWDWRLLASIAYQESNFNPGVTSWAGAIGLMQLMPETGSHFGINNLREPGQNIKAAVKFLKFLDAYWSKTVTDSTERLKFVLASYNVGLSHVIDAQKLAKKYGKEISVWDDHVEFYLLKKMESKYYRDPLAVAGYCRCNGPVIYVKEVLNRFEEYKQHIAA